MSFSDRVDELLFRGAEALRGFVLELDPFLAAVLAKHRGRGLCEELLIPISDASAVRIREHQGAYEETDEHASHRSHDLWQDAASQLEAGTASL